jgi:polyhydroxybutyrate depolymerase
MKMINMKKILPRILLIVLSIPVLLVLVVWAAFMISNRTNGSLTSAGEQRRYLLYVPDSYDPSTPAPLVISMHGFAEWPAHQQQISHWNDLADEYGFLMVYPMGTSFPLRWRANGDTGLMQDVTFISDLIDHLEGEYNVDPARIYANGLSNGGGMSFALSCKLSGRIAAIGSVAGAYLLPWDACTPSRPVPAIVFHGNADPIVPFAGGPSRSFDIPFPRIDDWVQTLVERNGCSSEPQALTGEGDASGMRYTGCDQDADVIYYTIDGGGHTWPGGDPLPEWITGATSDDIDATRLMWEFFQEHPLE